MSHAPDDASHKITAPENHLLSATLSRYIAVSFLVPFVCALVGFAALFLLNDVFDDIGDFIEKKVPLAVTILYFLAKQPANLTNVIPISVLLATSFMTLMLGRHNELTAMRAAGMSLFSSAMPVWIFATLACAAVFAINEAWGPACSAQAQEIHTRYLKHDKIRRRVAFHNPAAYRDWTISYLNTQGECDGITVRQYRPDGTSDFLLTAVNATFNNGTWNFKNGMLQHFDQTGNRPDDQPLFFNEYTGNFPESPADIGSHSRNWELMNIRELLNVLHGTIVTSPRILRLLNVLLWHRFTFPLASLAAALFGLALTISTDRMGLMRGFAEAVAALVLFYLCGKLGLVLAKNGWLTPFIGGAFPAIAFLVAAIFTMWKKQ